MAEHNDSSGQPNGTGQTDGAEQKDRRDASVGGQDDRRLSLGQIVRSVLAAALGVQSSENRERDFRQGRALTFIIAGIVSTAIFIGLVLAVVKLVLAGA
jgi:hypothetical protein